MNIDLHPDLEQFIHDQVKAGRFAAAGEVVEAAVTRLMFETSQDRSAFDPGELDELMAEAEAAPGEGTTPDEVHEHFRRRHDELRAGSQPQAVTR